MTIPIVPPASHDLVADRTFDRTGVSPARRDVGGVDQARGNLNLTIRIVSDKSKLEVLLRFTQNLFDNPYG